MSAETIACPECSRPVPRGRLSCPSCGALLASLSGGARRWPAGEAVGEGERETESAATDAGPAEVEPAEAEPAQVEPTQDELAEAESEAEPAEVEPADQVAVDDAAPGRSEGAPVAESPPAEESPEEVPAEDISGTETPEEAPVDHASAQDHAPGGGDRLERDVRQIPPGPLDPSADADVAEAAPSSAEPAAGPPTWPSKPTSEPAEPSWPGDTGAPSWPGDSGAPAWSSRPAASVGQPPAPARPLEDTDRVAIPPAGTPPAPASTAQAAPAAPALRPSAIYPSGAAPGSAPGPPDTVTPSPAVPADATRRPAPGDAPLLADLPLQAPASFPAWLIAGGFGLAVLGLLLPWSSDAIGAGPNRSYFDTWGLAAAGHWLIFVAVLIGVGIAFVPSKVPAWLRDRALAPIVAGLIVGIAWPYLVGGLDRQIGVIVAASGAILLGAGSILSELATRNGEPPPGV